MNTAAPETTLPTVLITGSSGFLGHAITQGLVGCYRVIGLDFEPPKNPINGVSYFEIDLRKVCITPAEARADA